MGPGNCYANMQKALSNSLDVDCIHNCYDGQSTKLYKNHDSIISPGCVPTNFYLYINICYHILYASNVFVSPDPSPVNLLIHLTPAKVPKIFLPISPVPMSLLFVCAWQARIPQHDDCSQTYSRFHKTCTRTNTEILTKFPSITHCTGMASVWQFPW